MKEFVLQLSCSLYNSYRAIQRFVIKPFLLGVHCGLSILLIAKSTRKHVGHEHNEAGLFLTSDSYKRW